MQTQIQTGQLDDRCYWPFRGCGNWDRTTPRRHGRIGRWHGDAETYRYPVALPCCGLQEIQPRHITHILYRLNLNVRTTRESWTRLVLTVWCCVDGRSPCSPAFVVQLFGAASAASAATHHAFFYAASAATPFLSS